MNIAEFNLLTLYSNHEYLNSAKRLIVESDRTSIEFQFKDLKITYSITKNAQEVLSTQKRAKCFYKIFIL